MSDYNPQNDPGWLTANVHRGAQDAWTCRTCGTRRPCWSDTCWHREYAQGYKRPRSGGTPDTDSR